MAPPQTVRRSRTVPARYPLQSGRTGTRPAPGDDGVPPELHAERNACVRQLARERDGKKKLQAQHTQVRQQLAAANAELDRVMQRSAQIGDPKVKLAAIKDECAMLRDALLERNAQLSIASDEYKGLEQRALGLEGGASLHPAEAAKRSAAAKVNQQRIKSDKKSIGTLVKQEQALADSVEDLRRRLDAATHTPSSSPVKQRGGEGDNNNSGGAEESIAEVQMQHDRQRKAAVDGLQQELAREDRELDRRREALEAAEEKRRQQAGSSYARAEQDRAAALNDHTATKNQLASQTAKAEALRKGLTTLTRDVEAAKEAEDRCEVERQGLERRAKELQAAIDAAIKKSLQQSKTDDAEAEAWRREKAELESGVKVAERRSKGVAADLKRVNDGIAQAETAVTNTDNELAAAENGEAATDDAELASLAKQAAADTEAAAKLEEEARGINDEAERVEARNALSQRDSIIEQQRGKLASLQQEAREAEKENADVRARLAKKEALLAQHGLSVDS